MRKFKSVAIREIVWVGRNVPFMLLVWAIVSLIGQWWAILVAIVAGAGFAYIEGFLWIVGREHGAERDLRKPRKEASDELNPQRGFAVREGDQLSVGRKSL